MKEPSKITIARSLETLLKKKSFDKITVGDIVENCNMSRTTFYRNFSDKYECANWIYQNRISEIVRVNRDADSWKNLIVQIAHFLYDKKEYFSKVANYREQNSLMDCIYQCGMDYALSLIQGETGSQEIPLPVRYCVHMYIAGSVEGIRLWLKEGCIGGPELLAEAQTAVMPAVLYRYFK